MIQDNYVKMLAKKNKREDGRNFDQYREPISVEYGVSDKSAEGSARVTIGDTVVVAGIKLELGKPYPDTPNEGSIMVNVELLPLSSPDYEAGPPSIDSIELARVVDRGIRESKALDFKKLCIKPGEQMWTVIIDIYPINAAGNLFDACALAALAALKDAKFPTLVEDKVDYKTRTDVPLPLAKLPISCTVYKIEGKYLIDPLTDEEDAADARLTVAITENGKICALQKGGDEPLNDEDLSAIVDLAMVKQEELRRRL